MRQSDKRQSDAPGTGVSPTELEILKVLWERGPGTVREVNGFLAEQGTSWAYTTALTLLQRLQAKGYVTSEKAGIAHVFRPLVSRDTLLRHRLRELADQLTEGTATPLVHALVEGHRFSAEDIESFRRLLDAVELRRDEPQDT